jgi:hypothetical protein
MGWIKTKTISRFCPFKVYGKHGKQKEAGAGAGPGATFVILASAPGAN